MSGEQVLDQETLQLRATATLRGYDDIDSEIDRCDVAACSFLPTTASIHCSHLPVWSS